MNKNQKKFYQTDIGITGSQIQGLDELYETHLGQKCDGVFVEVGAFNGLHWSNTYPLVQLGWRGLLIEPQPDQAQKCRDLYRGNPKIIVEECAVGLQSDKVKLYTGGSLSTTKEETIDTYNDMDWSRYLGLDRERYILVRQETLLSLLQKHDIPRYFDLLVVDVEGAESDVLHSFSLRYWMPTMAIIETHAKYPDDRLSRKGVIIDSMFLPLGYQKIYEDYINTVYWRTMMTEYHKIKP